jgi:tetratricopeptide (TPR) repeat protein
MTGVTDLQQAIAFHRAGDFSRAEALYRAVLKDMPYEAVAAHNLGLLGIRAGRLREALPLLQQAVRLAGDRAEFWKSLVHCRFLMGEWEAAAESIRTAAARGIDEARFAGLRQAMDGEPGGRKVFCVGRNKTGTTSMAAALRSLGFRVGLQARGEMLRRDWARRDFTRIIALCRTADAFQDVPFSNADTYRAVDAAFPGSRFVLTVRDSPEQWFESLVRFHTRIVNKGRIPTADDLREFEYRYKGYLWEAFVSTYCNDEKLLYDRDAYIANYLEHNRQVTEHFRDRPGDLLVLNVSQADAMPALCAFLGIEHQGQAMPHLNRTR